MCFPICDKFQKPDLFSMTLLSVSEILERFHGDVLVEKYELEVLSMYDKFYGSFKVWTRETKNVCGLGDKVICGTNQTVSESRIRINLFERIENVDSFIQRLLDELKRNDLPTDLMDVKALKECINNAIRLNLEALEFSRRYAVRNVNQILENRWIRKVIEIASELEKEGKIRSQSISPDIGGVSFIFEDGREEFIWSRDFNSLPWFAKQALAVLLSSLGEPKERMLMPRFEYELAIQAFVSEDDKCETYLFKDPKPSLQPTEMPQILIFLLNSGLPKEVLKKFATAWNTVLDKIGDRTLEIDYANVVELRDTFSIREKYTIPGAVVIVTRNIERPIGYLMQVEAKTEDEKCIKIGVIIST